ncbi:hypothetical protein K0M31_004148 [Melipona bicolor]|uniref:Uncharacterized protein n=1 Tax=Melipona bicolor TaxID=60889 RepID=A0AA40KP62_9HYME|nr:hypothetical protein K0M31_004148 [Melipona bicolor]
MRDRLMWLLLSFIVESPCESMDYTVSTSKPLRLHHQYRFVRSPPSRQKEVRELFGQQPINNQLNHQHSLFHPKNNPKFTSGSPMRNTNKSNSDTESTLSPYTDDKQIKSRLKPALSPK